MRALLVWLALAATLVAPGLAKAANWVKLSDDGKAQSYLDVDSIHYDGAVALAVVKWDFKQPFADPKLRKRIFSEIDTHAFNCAGSSYALFVSRTAYGERGEVVGQMSQPYDKLRFVAPAPNSGLDALMARVCRLADAHGGLKQHVLEGSIYEGDWRSYARSTDGGRVSFYRPDSFRKLSNDVVLVVVRRDFAHGYVERADLPLIYHAVQLLGIDCKQSSYQLTLYDGYGADGRLLTSGDASKSPEKGGPIKPESGLGGLQRKACEAMGVQVAQGAAPRGDGDGKDGASESNLVSGTGWLTNKGYLVTAAHVVDGARSIALFQDGHVVGKAEVVVSDVANDVAILKPKLKDGPRPAIPLATAPAELGESVFTLGFPAPDLMGVSLKLTTGTINATSGTDARHETLDDARLLQFSAPVQSGNSGGPVIDSHGHAVGVVVTKASQLSEKEIAENVNYALKVRYAKALLSELPDIGGYQIVTPQGDLPALAKTLRGGVFLLVVELADTPKAAER